MTHSEIVSFIWGVADLIRDSFKRRTYQDVIGPFDFEKLLDDHQNLATNLRRYSQGFSPNMLAA